jgi:hypothetical protein
MDCIALASFTAHTRERLQELPTATGPKTAILRKSHDVYPLRQTTKWRNAFCNSLFAQSAKWHLGLWARTFTMQRPSCKSALTFLNTLANDALTCTCASCHIIHCSTALLQERNALKGLSHKQLHITGTTLALPLELTARLVLLHIHQPRPPNPVAEPSGTPGMASSWEPVCGGIHPNASTDESAVEG